MISLIITVTAALVLVTGIVLNQNRIPEEIIPEVDNTQVLSGEDQNDNSNEVSVSNNNSEVEVNEGVSSVNIQITNNPQDNDDEEEDLRSNDVINNFLYSNSEIISRDDHTIRMESSDDPSQITDWYEQQLESMNFNVNSFVATNTNNNVNNELVSSNGSVQIKVVIEKQAVQEASTIVVMLN